jgi:hypothetical protein
MSVLPRRLTLIKRSNIYYILYYQNGRQRWKSTGATTKPEALQAVARFRELSEQRLQSIFAAPETAQCSFQAQSRSTF